MELSGMRDVELFARAMGVLKPWYVQAVDLDGAAQKVTTTLDFVRREGGSLKPGIGHRDLVERLTEWARRSNHGSSQGLSPMPRRRMRSSVRAASKTDRSVDPPDEHLVVRGDPQLEALMAGAYLVFRRSRNRLELDASNPQGAALTSICAPWLGGQKAGPSEGPTQARVAGSARERSAVVRLALRSRPTVALCLATPSSSPSPRLKKRKHANDGHGRLLRVGTDTRTRHFSRDPAIPR